MRGRSLSGLVIARLAGHKSKRLKDQEAWMAHLERLGITRLRVHPDPLKIATEGALWGNVVANGLLKDAVIVSDDAGQFTSALRLCWVHAERLIHRWSASTTASGRRVRGSGVVVLRRPEGILPRSHSAQKAGVVHHHHRLWLARLHANKVELLRALERPDIPLHTNGSGMSAAR